MTGRGFVSRSIFQTNWPTFIFYLSHCENRCAVAEEIILQKLRAAQEPRVLGLRLPVAASLVCAHTVTWAWEGTETCRCDRPKVSLRLPRCLLFTNRHVYKKKRTQTRIKYINVRRERSERDETYNLANFKGRLGNNIRIWKSRATECYWRPTLHRLYGAFGERENENTFWYML